MGVDVDVIAAETIPRGSDVVAVFVGPAAEFGASHLADLPNLTLVAATSTGYNHIDVTAIAAAGIWATHVADYCTEEVADHTIAHILGLLRQITQYDRGVHEGRWREQPSTPARIAGTRVGLVGYGRIARAVAERALALRMQVSVYSASVVSQPGEIQFCESLDALLRTVDVVSLHSPASSENTHMLDASAIAQMRPGALVVNTARPTLIDHRALVQALNSGHLGGAALDVLPQEPPEPHDPLLAVPNMVITPHAAWLSSESVQRPFQVIAEQLATVLAGFEPFGVIKAG
ncbi:NAD(P)-dependent oxidoreductase [Rhodococcus sp. NPDC057529]|uniref:NAD(P)-dependent oxidoreductase n=1 Tax=Rhodococcus sp. NPDC057529 TaxID=3346158 RepID=UPI00367175A6